MSEPTYSFDALGVTKGWGYEGQPTRTTIHKARHTYVTHPVVGADVRYLPYSKCGRILRPYPRGLPTGRPYRKCILCFGESGVVRIVNDGFWDER